MIPIFTPRAPNPPQIPEFGPITSTPRIDAPEVLPVYDVPSVEITSDPNAEVSVAATSLDAFAGSLISFNSALSNARYSSIRGGSVTVAVIDTGLQAGITGTGGAFAASRILATLDFANAPLAVGDPVTANDDLDVTTTNLHGTYVTGIVAANGVVSGTNYVGIAPEVNLVILKVLTAAGTGTGADLKQAVDWIATNAATYNVVAVNMSLSFNGTNDFNRTDTNFTPSFQSLVQNNVAVVAASGNDYYVPNPDALGTAYPSSDPYVWGVGSVWDHNYTGTFARGSISEVNPGVDQIPAYSQRLPYGQLVTGERVGLELVAPGSFINSVEKSGGNLVLSSSMYPDGEGTSYAAPYVTGAIALGQDLSLKMTENYSRFSVDGLRYLMQASADVIADATDLNDGVLNTQDQTGFNTNYSYYRLDVANFLGLMETTYKTFSAGADVMAGWVDNDSLAAGGGNDRVYGNAGNDTLFGEGGNDILIGGTGADYLFGGNGTPSAAGSGDDYLYGRDGDDGVWGGDGIDVISGENGVDGLVGNAGNDTIYGGAGADNIFGGDGAYAVGSGADLLYGDAGGDLIYGEDGADIIYGGADNDYIEGGDDGDSVFGEGGNDTVLGNAGSDQVGGGTGYDYLYGGAGADVFVYNKFDSADAILDFSMAQGDILKLNYNLGMSTFAQFQANITSFFSGGIYHTYLYIAASGDQLQIDNMATTDWTAAMVTFY